MSVTEQKRGLAVLCDERGVVREVMRNDLALPEVLAPGRPFWQCVDTESREKARLFLNQVKHEKAAFDCKFDLSLRGQVIHAQMSGCLSGGGVLITAHAVTEEATDCEKLMEIATEQMNSLRAAAKELMSKNRDLNQMNEEKNRLLQNALNHVAERREVERTLREAREAAEAANHAKDQFIAVLSHELRTPLMPVLATVTDLEGRDDVSSELQSDIKIIRRNVEMEAKMIDDLLDVTKISQGKIDLHEEVVNIHDCLKTVVSICEGEILSKGLQLQLELQGERTCVWGDRIRLRQILWNLLRNAVKFTPANGRITLSTINVEGRLQVRVQDSGIGFERELLPNIFGAFEQGQHGKERQFGGLGLGLSIAKTMVELHHGTISAFSEGEGKGATFTVELDTVAAPAAPVIASVPRSCGEPQTCRILLVEDHPDTLHAVTKVLRRWGYDVVTAKSVAEACTRASSGKFDLLVSDLGLPDGSGTDVIRFVKEHWGLRGIALSGYGTEADIRESRDAGFEEHLVKPVGFESLRKAIQRLTEHDESHAA